MIVNFTVKELETINDALWVSKVSRATDKNKKEKLRTKIHKIILELKRPYIEKTLKEIRASLD